MNKIILSGTIEQPQKRFTSDNKTIWNFKLQTKDFIIPVSYKSEIAELTESDLSVVVGSLYTNTNNNNKKALYINASSVELFNQSENKNQKFNTHKEDDLISEDEIPF